MSRALPPVVVVCLVAVGIAIRAAARHYGDTHPDAVIVALIVLVIGAVCVAYLVTWLRRLLRSRGSSATPS